MLAITSHRYRNVSLALTFQIFLFYSQRIYHFHNRNGLFPHTARGSRSLKWKRIETRTEMYILFRRISCFKRLKLLPDRSQNCGPPDEMSLLQSWYVHQRNSYSSLLKLIVIPPPLPLRKSKVNIPFRNRKLFKRINVVNY